MHFLSVSDAKDCRCFPTSTEPVKVTALGIDDLSKYFDILSGTPKIIFNTPCGNPASMKHSPIATAVPGVSSLGLIMIEHPAAKVEATFLITFPPGKFQATKAATGPIGSLKTICLACPSLEGIILPYVLFPSSAHQIIVSIT